MQRMMRYLFATEEERRRRQARYDAAFGTLSSPPTLTVVDRAAQHMRLDFQVPEIELYRRAETVLRKRAALARDVVNALSRLPADAEGTLGGLVQEARRLEQHLAQALRQGALCSNDPICAQHAPGQSLEQRWLHGAACHGCTLVAETSCEMRNDYLDRALVVPVLGLRDAAFFTRV